VPPSDTIRFVGLEFHHFKGLDSFSLSLQSINILVGPNNCGKSTIISAFRLLDVALRRARTRNPELTRGPDGETFGYPIPKESSPISLENVHTNYADLDSGIVFKLSNGSQLLLHFPKGGEDCTLIARSKTRAVRTAGAFRTSFPLALAIVPVLGPLEHDEELVEAETVERNRSSHRASRHFRNYWYHFGEGFDAFAQLIVKTWPGMSIERPQKVDALSRTLHMFCFEGRIARELYWAGFGFQVWCQLLTHTFTAADATILVIDEPEIYLHPDVQRQLLSILRDIGPDILIATHSTEIMSEADPSEIVVVDKSRRSAHRLRDIEEVQSALELVGSIQNITLMRLARNRRILFVEDDEDFIILRRFARVLGLVELASGADITAVPSGGFSSWERVTGTGWGLQKALGSVILIAAVYDRDFLCEDEVKSIIETLEKQITMAWIHPRKEIENYFLVLPALQRALESAVRERSARTGEPIPVVEMVERILRRVTAPMKNDTLAQYIDNRNRFLRSGHKHPATLTAETTAWFEEKWRKIETRLEIVPGKSTLAGFRQTVQSLYSVTITDARIIGSFKPEDIPPDLVTLLRRLANYRTMKPAPTSR